MENSSIWFVGVISRRVQAGRLRANSIAIVFDILTMFTAEPLLCDRGVRIAKPLRALVRTLTRPASCNLVAVSGRMLFA